MPVEQSRFVCVTDYREVYQEAGYLKLPPRTQFVAWGHEICPDTQRPHLQVYAYGEKRSVAAWAKDFGKSHVELMRGSMLQNADYCSKQSELKKLGVEPLNSGQKRCLIDITDEILRNPTRPPAHIAVDDPDMAPVYVQYHRGLEKLAAAAREKRIKGDFTAPEVHYVYGPPGCGKSRLVFEREPDVYDVPPADGYKWKDGYYGQDAVLYDNLAPKDITCPSRLLKELDRYPTSVDVKGGFTPWKPKRIYITALIPPDEMARAFQKSNEFLRRITTITNFDDI